MAAQFTSVLGETLQKMLLSDGWKVEWIRQSHIHMSKENKEVGFTLNKQIPLKPAKAIARNKAGWTAEEFEEFKMKVTEKN